MAELLVFILGGLIVSVGSFAVGYVVQKKIIKKG